MPRRPSETERRRLAALVLAAPGRLAMLCALQRLELPDAWIAAGALREAVWDRLHGRRLRLPRGDVDVIWFGAGADAATDRALEARLRAAMPRLAWSVKNQARMHLRNGDPPYRDCAAAMRHWPETATALAMRLRGGRLEVLAPFGLGDLFGLRLRPTPAFAGEKHRQFRARLAAKRWHRRWPRLRLVPARQAGAPPPRRGRSARLTSQ